MVMATSVIAAVPMLVAFTLANLNVHDNELAELDFDLVVDPAGFRERHQLSRRIRQTATRTRDRVLPSSRKPAEGEA